MNLPTATALASSPEIVNLPLLNFRDLRCHSRISPSVTSIGNFSVVFLPLSMAILAAAVSCDLTLGPRVVLFSLTIITS